MSKDEVTTTEILLPPLGDSVAEATIISWLKAPGEQVSIGEAIAEAATDKVDTEIESTAAGILLEILAAEDTTVEVGAPIARIEQSIASESDGGAVDENGGQRAPEPVPPTATVSADDGGIDGAAMQPAASPQPASATPPNQVAGSRTEKLTAIRRTIARRMLESLHTTAQLTTVVEADVTRIALLRNRRKEAFHRVTGTKLSYFPFFVKAAVEALVDHPVLNASLNEDCTEVTYHSSVHLGVAVDNEKGLMVPVIRDAQTMTIAGLAAAIASRAESVRNATARPDDFSGGTFTITNTGSRGALFDTPIINAPQSAILGVGAVVDRVVPIRDGESVSGIGVRTMVYLSISYDHRIVDGADAARFLTAVRGRLEAGFDAADLDG
jgi:2-oxoglutarate dehydrogenase E2 component (dihydrolipoamide succinyltransferase)